MGLAEDLVTTNRARPWFNQRPWHHAGHRILRPFTKPEGSFGIGWCRRCQEYGTGRREARFEGCTYAVKETCRRCGAVINYAVYAQSGDPSTAARAQEWATSREEV